MGKIKHRKSSYPEYPTWVAMRNRCNNKDNEAYNNYGKRGITVCQEWEASFDAFITDMGRRQEGFTLERINNEKGYSKENCRWATRYQNARNKRNNVLVTLNGKEMILKDAAKKLNLPYGTVVARIKTLGWSIDKALKTPVKKQSSIKCKNGHMWVNGTYTFDNRGLKYCLICSRERDRKRRPALGTNKTRHLKRERGKDGRFM